MVLTWSEAHWCIFPPNRYMFERISIYGEPTPQWTCINVERITTWQYADICWRAWGKCQSRQPPKILLRYMRSTLGKDDEQSHSNNSHGHTYAQEILSLLTL